MLQIIAGLLVAAFGGGGIASLIKARADKLAGVKAQALAESSASEEWWQDRMRLQAEAIVEPLRAEVVELRGQVATLRAEVESAQTRYWRSIITIRSLYDWIKKNLPESTPPPPHPDIADDI